MREEVGSSIARFDMHNRNSRDRFPRVTQRIRSGTSITPRTLITVFCLWTRMPSLVCENARRNTTQYDKRLRLMSFVSTSEDINSAKPLHWAISEVEINSWYV
jgi:hypothetical protein